MSGCPTRIDAQSLDDRFSIARCTACGSGVASISAQRAGSAAAISRKPRRNRSWNGQVEALEAIAGGVSRSGARKPDLDRQIEDQGQIGREIAERETMQRRNVVPRASPRP